MKISSPCTPSRCTRPETIGVSSSGGYETVRRSVRKAALCGPQEAGRSLPNAERRPMGSLALASDLMAVSAVSINNSKPLHPSPVASRFLTPTSESSTKATRPGWSTQSQAYLEEAENPTRGEIGQFRRFWVPGGRVRRQTEHDGETTRKSRNWLRSRPFWLRFAGVKFHHLCASSPNWANSKKSEKKSVRGRVSRWGADLCPKPP